MGVLSHRSQRKKLLTEVVLTILLGTILIGGTLTLFWLAAFRLPRVIARQDSEYVNHLPLAQRTRGANAVEDARTALITMALGAGVLGTAYMAWVRLRLDRLAAQTDAERLRLEVSQGFNSRLTSAMATLAHSDRTVRLASIGELGHLMVEMDNGSSPLAQQIATLLSNCALEASRAAPRSAATPAEVTACLAAFEGADPGTTLWIDLRQGDFSGWTLDLPTGIEVDLRGAELTGAHLRGLASYVRLDSATSSQFEIDPGVSTSD